MDKELIVDTAYASLWYYPEDKIIHHEFHKFIHGDMFRDVLMQGFETFRHHGVQKWLSDDRKNTTVPQSDIEWANENWFTAMKEAGWQYWAMVMPDSKVGQASMRRIIESYSARGVTVETFDTPQDALDWLKSV